MAGSGLLEGHGILGPWDRRDVPRGLGRKSQCLLMGPCWDGLVQELSPTFPPGLAPCCAMGMCSSSSPLLPAWRSWRRSPSPWGQTKPWLAPTSRWTPIPSLSEVSSLWGRSWGAPWPPRRVLTTGSAPEDTLEPPPAPSFPESTVAVMVVCILGIITVPIVLLVVRVTSVCLSICSLGGVTELG